jgi:hypothetical protein
MAPGLESLMSLSATGFSPQTVSLDEVCITHDSVPGRLRLRAPALKRRAAALPGAAAGARRILACGVHAVLSGPAVERIEKSAIKEVVVTNSIPLTKRARQCSKINALSVAPLLARAVQSIHEETSVSILFV